MKILAIETSCDDTGVALAEVTEDGVRIISSALSSQDDVHRQWGGVYPTEAKREHQQNLFPAFLKVVTESGLVIKEGLSLPDSLEDVLRREPVLLKSFKDFFAENSVSGIDAIAVTRGPGLEPCLFVGVNFARALSLSLNTPIIPVNHIKAHLLFFLQEKTSVTFPAVALVVSGGHTELVLMESPSSFQLLGRTRDDAAGECLDKTARILNLGYPGGPLIAKKAATAREEDLGMVSLPRPMQHTDNFDFSFSGLKTAVLYDYNKRSEEERGDERYICAMAKEIEEAVTDVLLFKVKKAVQKHGVKTVIMGGGVTANKRLREKALFLQEEFDNLKILFPPPGLSTDNAEMIAIAASAEKERWSAEKLSPDANLKIYDIIG